MLDIFGIYLNLCVWGGGGRVLIILMSLVLRFAKNIIVKLHLSKKDPNIYNGIHYLLKKLDVTIEIYLWSQVYFMRIGHYFFSIFKKRSIELSDEMPLHR